MVCLSPAAEENLKMLRGHVFANGTYAGGVGFSVQKLSTGKYRITFINEFTDAPTCVATTYNQPDNWITITNRYNNMFDVETYDATSSYALQDTEFDFIVLGPR